MAGQGQGVKSEKSKVGSERLAGDRREVDGIGQSLNL